MRGVKVITAHGLVDAMSFSAQSTAPSVDVHCGERTVRFVRRVSRAKYADERPAYETRIVGDATVIVVRTLWGSPDVKRTLERIAADYDEHRKKRVVVFDLRGNGGGDDSYIYAWIKQAKRGTWSQPYVDVRVTGAATACGDWNELVAEQMMFHRIDAVDAKRERDAFERATPLGGAPGAPSQAIGRSSVTSQASSPYTGRIFVVVDAASASSGESGADALRAALGATLVGERTAGLLELGNLRPYAMPRTGVLWQLGSKRNYYPEPRDGVGLAVDFVLDAELADAPIETLLPLLETLR